MMVTYISQICTIVLTGHVLSDASDDAAVVLSHCCAGETLTRLVHSCNIQNKRSLYAPKPVLCYVHNLISRYIVQE